MDELIENNLGEPKRKLVLNFRARIALGGILFATVLISGGFFLGYADELGGWGYFGAFFISLISSATIIFPSPGILLVMEMANTLDWGVVRVCDWCSRWLGWRDCVCVWCHQ